jgi:hypothetical protein
MKKYLHILAFSLISITCFSQNRILTRNADGGIYNPTLNPGDVIELSGDYTYLAFTANGTVDKPITFINKGIVRIGSSKHINYGIRAGGKHFKIIATDVNGQRGIQVGHPVDRIGLHVALGNSTNYTIERLELLNCEVGFFSNPTSGVLMVDCVFRENFIRDLTHPPSSSTPNPTGPEAFYLGATSGKYDAVRFVNCIIEGNIIENNDGDAIQVANGTFIIRNNIIRNFARISRSSHRNGILSGGYATSQIEDNVIDGGKGVAINILGGGEMNVKRNKISNVNVTGLGEDIVYIDGRAGGLKLNFENNEFSNLTGYRKIIGNYTKVATPGSVFTNNTGVTQSQTTLLSVDKWNQITTPIIYYNVSVSRTFTRSNCTAGETPGTATYIVAAGKYQGSTQGAADLLAQTDLTTNGQNYANANATCTPPPEFFNVAASKSFTRNNCPASYTTTPVTYSVPAGKYKASTQAGADALAQGEINNSGQTYANTNGVCTAPPKTIIKVITITIGSDKTITITVYSDGSTETK